MSTAILNPKAQFLLGAGLDVLHFESKEWLDHINLWKDEITFFNVVLKKKSTAEKSNSNYQKILNNIDTIYNDLFQDLEQSIIEHEKLLSKIEKGDKGLSDNDYREKHQQILLRMNTFTKDFVKFKKMLFDYEKGL
ncbi:MULTISPECIES: hypothetical protein [unclassified Flavobacterium]|uniref:hypothetical protein n=1 Tax=unclassified Flavobacterium TaxID=196869 RepID=UPI00156F8E0C|nr:MULTISPECIES: hypothetical protein [unclassified Flavobacterium]MBE0391902.1 hypothetical protein [Flavobacterium sp. PL002]NRT16346.1 hypothetical protein [Flavobacterium sp. 28A]